MQRISWLVFCVVVAGCAGNLSDAPETETRQAQASRPVQYLVVHDWKLPYPGPTSCDASWIKGMIDELGSRGTPARRLGFAQVIYLWELRDRASVKACVAKLTKAAEAHDLPFMLHIDTEYFWRHRPDLWNWFDPNRPGYNPDNRFNVEWRGWDEPVRSSFIRWGQDPIELAPAPCKTSPVVVSQIKSLLGAAAEQLASWKRHLASVGREDLLIGIDVGWETGINDHRGCDWLSSSQRRREGYCALHHEGFRAASGLSETQLHQEISDVVQRHEAMKAKVARNAGLPKEKVFTHIWGADTLTNQCGRHAPLEASVNGDSQPGLSLYGDGSSSQPHYDRQTVAEFVAQQPAWAITEAPPSLPLSTFFRDRSLKLAVVYAWNATGVLDTPARKDALRQVLLEGNASAKPIGHVDRIDDQGKLRGWACLPGYEPSIDVHLYAGAAANAGGSFMLAARANVSSEAAVARVCGVSGSAYRFSIAFDEAQRQRHGGETIFVHGISPLDPAVNGASYVTGSGRFRVPMPAAAATPTPTPAPAPAPAPADDFSISWEFNTNGDTEGWKEVNLRSAPNGPQGGTWIFTAEMQDPMLLGPTINLDASRVSRISIGQANAGNPAAAGTLQLFWKRADEPFFSESKSVKIAVTNDGGWRTYTLPVGDHPGWTGQITQLRVDPIRYGDGHAVGLNFIRVD